MFRYRKEIEALLPLSKKELLAKMAKGYSVDLKKISGYEYKGVSLGLPPFIEKLTWKKFKKAFYFDEAKNIYRGYNIKIGQNPLHDEYYSLSKKGRQRIFGHFTLHKIEAGNERTKKFSQYQGGVLIDYGVKKFSAMAAVRDPLVSLLADDDHSLLLGFSALLTPFKVINTSSFFVLEQDIPTRPPQNIP